MEDSWSTAAGRMAVPEARPGDGCGVCKSGQERGVFAEGGGVEGGDEQVNGHAEAHHAYSPPAAERNQDRFD